MFLFIILLSSIQALFACPNNRSLREEDIQGKNQFDKVLSAPVCNLGQLIPSIKGYITAYEKAKTDYLNELGSLVVNPEPPPGVIDLAIPVALRAAFFRQANMAGNTLRVTFHDAGEFKKTTADLNGPDGCLSASAPNSGLVESSTFVVSFLEPLWQTMCDKISRADFWAMMGKIAAEAADPTATLNIPLRFGRKDSTNCEGGINRLPDHQIGITEYQRVFVNQMGLTMAEGVALVGAHTVGHVHPEFSGFGINATLAELTDAPQTNGWDETTNIFDNQYYTSLIGEPWINVQMDRASLGKNHWNVAEGIVPFVPGVLPEVGITVLPSGLGGLIIHPATQMLNADMVIAFPIDVSVDPVLLTPMGITNEYCALDAVNGQYGCKSPTSRKVGWPAALYDQALKYTGGTLVLIPPVAPAFGPPVLALVATPGQVLVGNALFFKDYSRAYLKMTSVGYGVTNNKLGPNLTRLPICQFSGFCRANNNCVAGNKCVNPTSATFSQCLADPRSFSKKRTCIKNFDLKCSISTTCCDPGAFCDNVTNPANPQCRQPKAADGMCVTPTSFETGF